MIGSLYANIEYRCADAMELDYSDLDTRYPPVVINTICEHLPDLADWWARIPHRSVGCLAKQQLYRVP